MRSESKISVIYTIKASDKDFKLYESLFSYIQKSKSDIELLLVESGKSADLVSTIEKNPVWTDLVSKTKAKLLRPEVAGSFADACAYALHIAGGSMSVLLEDLPHLNIANLITWVSSNKKNIKNGELWAGSNLLKASVNKSDQTTKRILKLYNAFVRFLTPLNLRDNNPGVLVAQTETAESFLKIKAAAASSFTEVFYMAACTGTVVNEFPLNTDKKIPAKGFTSILSVPFMAFMLRWKYFISASLREMKLENKVSLWDGSNPIYRMAFFILILVSGFAMPYLSFDYGITWDSKLHNEYGYKMLDYFETFGKDTTCFTSHRDYPYYGEQINVISAFVNRNNLSPWGEFETRHFINSLYGLLGLICIALAAKEIAGWRAGILAILFTLFNPGWLGNSMNNPTDLPFATGFAVAMYFIIKVLKGLPKPKLAHLVWVGIGAGIGIGSRIGALLIFAYAGLFLGIHWLIMNRENATKAGKLFMQYAKIFLVIFIVGYVVGIMLWPYALHLPFKIAYLAFKQASSNTFFAYNVELFEGKRLFMLTQTPWYYVFKFLGIGNPVYLVLGFVISILGFKWMKDKYNPALILVLIFMFLFPIIYSELSKLNHYNGWRHYLFVMPSWLALAAVSYEFLFSLKNKIFAGLSMLILLVLFIKPAIWMFKNHPNEYVYFNEFVGGINGAYGHYETDYYSNSCRAAGEWLAKNEPGKKVVAINNEPLTASYWAQKINPDLKFQWVREYEEQKTNWDYLILTTRTYSSNELLNGSFPPKGTIHIIKADDAPLAVIVKRENDFMPMGYKQFEAHHFDTAIMYFTKAVNYEPKDEEANRMLGQAYLNNGSFDTAEIYINKAIEIYPENYSAYSNKGMIYLNRKDYDKAVANFKKALSFKRNLTEAYYFAAVCEMSRNNYLAAIPFLEDAIKNNGQVPEIYYNLGIAYLNTGNYNKAEDALNGALYMNPKMGQAYAALAQTYQKLNKSEEAKYCMQKYKELGGQ